MIDECYDEAKKVVDACCSRNGMFASGRKGHYDALWSRDSMITLLGASMVDSKRYRATFKRSLEMLAANQSASGQIPNCVDKYSKRRPHVDYASIDSTLWYIIGCHLFKQRYGDVSIFNKHKGNIKKSLSWLRCMDIGEVGLLTQLPTTDWQDAFPHKYGHAISTQALYYKVLCLEKKSAEALKLKKVVNSNKSMSLWNGKYYLPYRWKNHNDYKEQGEWFDSWGNLLAVAYGLADRNKSRSIIDYMKNNKISSPYPSKCIWPPIKKTSKHWQDYFNDCDAREPGHYLNGGIWPFIGGMHVVALIGTGHKKEAGLLLENLAISNLKGDFPEWICPRTKKSYGKLQAWSAGMYILAYKSVKAGKRLI